MCQVIKSEKFKRISEISKIKQADLLRLKLNLKGCPCKVSALYLYLESD
jgi:hypothetical protein